MTYIDLTHTFTTNMPVYPGDPEPKLVDVASVKKEGWADQEIKTSMHVGTHMDAPGHMIEGGKKLSDYPISHFFGRGHLLDARGKEAIDIELLEGKEIQEGNMVLVMTGLYHYFGSPKYFEIYPPVTEAFAEKLAELGVKLLGLDSCTPDSSPYPIHKMLLKNDILIAENLTNLEALLGHSEFEIIALPAKLQTDGAPARVVAKIKL